MNANTREYFYGAAGTLQAKSLIRPGTRIFDASGIHSRVFASIRGLKKIRG
jgi:hypothetical protein